MPHRGEGKGLHIHRVSAEMKGDSMGRDREMRRSPADAADSRRGQRIGKSAPEKRDCRVVRGL